MGSPGQDLQGTGSRQTGSSDSGFRDTGSWGADARRTGSTPARSAGAGPDDADPTGSGSRRADRAVAAAAYRYDTGSGQRVRHDSRETGGPTPRNGRSRSRAADDHAAGVGQRRPGRYADPADHAQPAIPGGVDGRPAGAEHGGGYRRGTDEAAPISGPIPVSERSGRLRYDGVRFGPDHAGGADEAPVPASSGVARTEPGPTVPGRNRPGPDAPPAAGRSGQPPRSRRAADREPDLDEALTQSFPVAAEPPARPGVRSPGDTGQRGVVGSDRDRVGPPAGAGSGGVRPAARGPVDSPTGTGPRGLRRSDRDQGGQTTGTGPRGLRRSDRDQGGQTTGTGLRRSDRDHGGQTTGTGPRGLRRSDARGPVGSPTELASAAYRPPTGSRTAASSIPASAPGTGTPDRGTPTQLIPGPRAAERGSAEPPTPAPRAAEPHPATAEPPPPRPPATTTGREPLAADATALYRPAAPIRDVVLSTVDLVKVHEQGPRSVVALDEVTLDVERGRFTAIMGASGSGKSTLLHCLAGLDKPTRGSVRLGPTDLTKVSERKLSRLRRDRIGFVFQSYDLLPQLTARQNIVLPIEVAGRKLDQKWLDTVLDALELGGLLRQLPAQLSGGEQQRVAVARAVLTRPEVVLADEPTGALDAGTTREMVGFLRASVDHLGQTVVMVTHDPLAAQHTDRAVILHGGRLVGEVAQPSAHGVLDALAALADTPVTPDGHATDRDPAPGGRRAGGRSRFRLPSLRLRPARRS